MEVAESYQSETINVICFHNHLTTKRYRDVKRKSL